MKKIIISMLVAFGLTSFSANADMTNVGIKLTSGEMDASGSHTNNSSVAVPESRSADFIMGSLFVERQIEGVFNGNDIALGLDIVPLTAEIDKIGGGTGFDATLEIGNLVTAYVQPMFKTSDNVTLFVKAGYAQADLDISEIKRQATSSATTDSASTDGNTSKTLEGPMFGAGVQVAMNSVLDFVRLEGTVTDFDQITHTNSNGKVLKADAELTQISLSLVKSF